MGVLYLLFRPWWSIEENTSRMLHPLLSSLLRIYYVAFCSHCWSRSRSRSRRSRNVLLGHHRTHPLADMFWRNISASGCRNIGAAERIRCDTGKKSDRKTYLRSSHHAPAADMRVVRSYLMDVFHVVYKVICASPPILLVLRFIEQTLAGLS